MYFKKRGDKRPLCKRMYNWFRRKLNLYKHYLSQLFPTDILATTHITKQKITKANQYKRRKSRREFINETVTYNIMQDTSRTDDSNSPIFIPNNDDNINNNVSLHIQGLNSCNNCHV